MVAVARDAGWGEDFGQAVEELEGRETDSSAAGEVGPREDVEDLVGTAIDEMEAFEGEGSPGTIADQALESDPVGGLDPNAGVEAEPTTVIPAEHVLSVVGFQEAVAAKVAEDPASDRVLETLQELMGEGGGFVEAKACLWMRRILSRVPLNLLEESVHDAKVEVEVRVQR